VESVVSVNSGIGLSLLIILTEAMKTDYVRSPHIRQLTSLGKLTEAKLERADGAFFMYIGPHSDDERLYVSLPHVIG